ncbi:D-amino acid dehydrogenase small subunit [Hasllibacter halocynthiae]|uniref:D-amino acid dehydrogenase small subunit n=1 Tax=Hasllibacter halocynthiae TaxID=595589 RepID=A0A2T0X3Y4_9RHOB|nr:D-amino acid dehydrogenase [Hasllibacter halocynthiae]PRY93574.1 D-amino acid dehydrogenase small subunit [Hasllibacter halocynthiae]
MARIVVVGAGIAGIHTAYRLWERGHEVTVADRQRYAGMETSFANGGQLSASNAETWNQWGTVLKGMRWMLRRDAPLLVHPAPSLHKVGWMLEFLGAIPRWRENTIETVRMAMRARPLIAEMQARTGVDYDHSPAGILHFYGSEREMRHAREVTRLYAEGGLERRELSAEEVRACEPRLVADTVGGFWTESDATGCIHKFTAGVADWLEGRGVRFLYGAPVDDVRPRPGGGVEIDRAGRTEAFDAVVIAAGVGSRALARRLGDRVNVYPVKGYSITVNLDDEASRAAAPRVSLLDDKAKIVTARLGEGRFRIAGTAEFAGEDRDIRMGRIAPLTAWVERHFPEVSTEAVVPWAGLRPMMPDMMPRVGPGRNPGVFYNTGHGHLGWTLSAATGAVIAAAVDARIGDARQPAAAGMRAA